MSLRIYHVQHSYSTVPLKNVLYFKQAIFVLIEPFGVGVFHEPYKITDFHLLYSQCQSYREQPIHLLRAAAHNIHHHG